MKIVFISNYYNHHQRPFGEALFNISSIDFTFIATQKISEDRVALGYNNEFSNLSYYKEAIGDDDIATAEAICFDADVVVLGSAPVSFVKRRVRARKLTFSYNERWFKEGFFKHPGDVYRAVRDFSLRGNANYYQLCASAYTAGDSKKVFAFPNRKFRWGYFPETKKYADVKKMMSLKSTSSILWVGRFIDWKHPEDAIDMAKQLKNAGYKFELNMIGNGELEDVLKEKVEHLELGDCVHFLGTMSPEDVRKHMEHSQIFLCTSDFNEGWGAVLNEAMNSGCAVVASHAVGAVPYLMEHGINGFVYSSGYNDELYAYVARLLDHKDLCDKLGRNAYLTITELWNSTVAANRLYEFCCAKLAGESFTEYESGPLSQDYGKVKNSEKFKFKKY